MGRRLEQDNFLVELAERERPKQEELLSSVGTRSLLDYARTKTVADRVYREGIEYITNAKKQSRLDVAFDFLEHRLHEILAVVHATLEGTNRTIVCSTDATNKFICHLWGLPPEEIRRGPFGFDFVPKHFTPDAMKVVLKRGQAEVRQLIEGTTAQSPDYFVGKLRGFNILQTRQRRIMGRTEMRFLQPDGTPFPFHHCDSVISDHTEYTAGDLRGVASEIFNKFRPNPRVDDSLAEARVQMLYILNTRR